MYQYQIFSKVLLKVTKFPKKFVFILRSLTFITNKKTIIDLFIFADYYENLKAFKELFKLCIRFLKQTIIDLLIKIRSFHFTSAKQEALLSLKKVF